MFELDAGSALSVVDGASMSLRHALPAPAAADQGAARRAAARDPPGLLPRRAAADDRRAAAAARRGKMLVSSLRRIVCAPFCAVDLWSSFCADVLASFVKPPPTSRSARALPHLRVGEAEPAQGACRLAALRNSSPRSSARCRCGAASCSASAYHDTRKLARAAQRAGTRWRTPSSSSACSTPTNSTRWATPTSARTRACGCRRVVFCALGRRCTRCGRVRRLAPRRRPSGARPQRRMFRNRTWYYLAILADFVLRFGWTATLVPGTQPIPGLPYLDNSYWWVQPVVAVASSAAGCGRCSGSRPSTCTTPRASGASR